MSKIIYLLLSVLLIYSLSGFTTAQDTTGFQIPGTPLGNNFGKNFEVFGSGVDTQGNLFLVGTYDADVPGYPTVNPNAPASFFISKYSNDTLLWAIQSNYTLQNPVAVDENGDVFANGFTGSETNFTYVFAKYNGTSGSIIWIRVTSLITNVTADTYVATDGSNLFGYAPFAGSVDFLDENNNVKATINGTGASENFIVKYTSDGIFQWVKQSHANSEASIAAQFITADKDGNSYALGSYTGCTECSFESLTLTPSNESFQNGFMLKLDPSGGFVWLKEIISEGVFPAANVVDEENNVIATGSWASQEQPLEAGDLSLGNSNGTSQAFIVKFNNSTGTVEYLRSTRSDGDTTAQSVDCEQRGCWFTGAFSGQEFRFGDIVLQGNATSVNIAYFAEINTTGEAVTAFNGTGPSSQGTAVSIDRERERVFAIGTFANSETIAGFTFQAGNNTKTFVLQFESGLTFQ